VDSFWYKCERFSHAKDRTIDIDNLQGITIFLIWKLCDPTILIDCFLITEFAEFATKSNFYNRRMGFVKYVQASLDFLLELDLTNQEETVEELTVEEETKELVENNDHFSGLPNIEKINFSRFNTSANFIRQRKLT